MADTQNADGRPAPSPPRTGPDRVFSAGSSLALLSWLSLSASLFTPAAASKVIWMITMIGVPAVIGVAYAVLLIQGMREKTGGGFGSIAAVRRLFTSDAALAAGWLHYLAFDLFVGTWIARDGLVMGVPRLLILPCLLSTFMVGPVGLVLFLMLRLLFNGHLGLDF